MGKLSGSRRLPSDQTSAKRAVGCSFPCAIALCICYFPDSRCSWETWGRCGPPRCTGTPLGFKMDAARPTLAFCRTVGSPPLTCILKGLSGEPNRNPRGKLQAQKAWSPGVCRSLPAFGEAPSWQFYALGGLDKRACPFFSFHDLLLGAGSAWLPPQASCWRESSPRASRTWPALGELGMGRGEGKGRGRPRGRRGRSREGRGCRWDLAW